MNKDVVYVKTEDSVLEAIETLRKNRISGAPVIDDNGKIAGVFSGTDFIRMIGELTEYHPFLIPFFELLENDRDDMARIYKQAASKTVKDAMSKPAVTVREDAGVDAAAALMWKKDINRLPVADKKGALIGIISRKDILRAFEKKQ